jgi:prevent-host-death family protein
MNKLVGLTSWYPRMKEVGVFEAKTRLSELVDKVTAGEEFVITRRGVAVARLVPVNDVRASEIQQAVQELADFSAGRTVGAGGWKALRDAGRRW